MDGSNVAADTKTIVLRKPVKLGSQTIDHLDLREPTALEVSKAQQESMRNGGLSSDILLIAQVSGVPVPVVEKIGIRDVREASDFLATFLQGTAETIGNSSSPS